MNAPLTQLRQVCLDQMLRAAAVLGIDPPRDVPLRYRADGKGGVLASPYPMKAGSSPQTIADACPGDLRLESIAPSGQWLAFIPSEVWYEEIRCFDPPALTAHEEAAIPPPPRFPARVDDLSWSLCCLLGHEDPALAARLDLENPRFLLQRVHTQAQKCRGENRPSRRLLRECVLLEEHLRQQDAAAAARQALAIARWYAADPAEDVAVGKLLEQLPWI